jgi:hypothetical protein
MIYPSGSLWTVGAWAGKESAPPRSGGYPDPGDGGPDPPAAAGERMRCPKGSGPAHDRCAGRPLPTGGRDAPGTAPPTRGAVPAVRPFALTPFPLDVLYFCQ